MLTRFDQNTIVMLTAALDYVCKKIPADKDSHELRRRIADELVESVRAGRGNLIELQNAGLKVVRRETEQPRFGWFGLRRSRR
ncbi:MAG: hypothetical protein HY852_02775 [Bradyrhizobium sp.]|uniref:hypothetical protein n=1 Tax=Bradyrhizobium sp. TaxID=376 RepID=UPI0025C491FD|nr:hypothetical protein [Bradyrhizobium sp.]MBI5260727.1 hypothetical protein [Bradyrhizobium sp.]